VLHTETAVGAYNVYGSGNAQRVESAKQRHASTGIKQQTSQSRIINVAGDGGGRAGYLNTQPNHHGDFDTETSNQNRQMDEDIELIRRHQMVLMAPENDEDEIIDLLASQMHERGKQGNSTHGSTSKMSIAAPANHAVS
jgi:hypothetical protein